MNEHEKEFNKLAEIVAQTTLDLTQMAKGLNKKGMYRVFLATMEYPMKNTKELMSQDEVDTAKLAIGLKEMQMKLAMLNLAIKENEEAENGEV